MNGQTRPVLVLGIINAQAVLAASRATLDRAKHRLDTLALYPKPVKTRTTRILITPWLFHLPFLWRFDG